MTLVLTGATGFIGGRLVRKLRGEGIALRCLVRASSRTKELEDAGAELAVVDLAAGQGVERALEGAEAVIHLAGAVRSWNAEGFRMANVEATRQLAEAANRVGVGRFVLVSSLAAAGPSPRGVALTEDLEPDPIGLYGQSKLAAERVLAEVAAPELDWSIVRPSIVYGPRDRDVFALFRSCARGLGVYVAPPRVQVSMVHVDDVLQLVMAAVERAPRGAVYFCSDGEAYTWRRIVEAIAAALERKVLPLRVPPTLVWPLALAAETTRLWKQRPPLLSRQKVLEARQVSWVCSPAKASAELGYEAQWPLREGIAQAAEWYRKEGWL